MRLSTPVQNPLAAEEATEGRVSKTAGCRSVCCTCTDYLKSFKERVLFGGSHNNYNLCWPTTIPATEKTQPRHVYVNEKLLKKVFSSSGQPTGGKPTTCHSVFFLFTASTSPLFFFSFFAFAALLDSSFLIVVCRACHILHFNKSELWPRCLRELVSCKHLIAFVEEGVLNVLLCSDELITISPLRLQWLCQSLHDLQLHHLGSRHWARRHMNCSLPVSC